MSWLNQAVASAELMQQHGISVSRNFMYHMLQECTKLQNLELGHRIQSLMSYSGLDLVAVLTDHLIRLFSTCGSLIQANQVFSKVSKPTQYTWNAIIDANAKHGHGGKAHSLYARMLYEGEIPNKFTFSSILTGCNTVGALEQGRQIHNEVVETGHQFDIVVGSSLVDMYCKCGSLDEARRVFDIVPIKNIVSWGAMIMGHAQHLEGYNALECFEGMLQNGIRPSRVIYLGILKACIIIGFIEQGRYIHEQILDNELQLDPMIGSMLVNMYAKCGSLEEACMVFDRLPNRDVVLWGTMIAGFTQHDKLDMISEYVEEMQHGGLKPSKVIFSSMLKACGVQYRIQQGRLIHQQLIETGTECDSVIGVTLVDMYAKCSSIEEARGVFDRLSTRDAMSWGAIITGYAQEGLAYLALECFNGMVQDGRQPNRLVFPSVLKACGSIGDIVHGRCIHEHIMEDGSLFDIVVGSSLIDMYVRGGSLDEARNILDRMPNQNAVSWGAMIAGYAQYGKGELALECFKHMQHDGVKPDKHIFSSILKACGSIHAIEQGRVIHKQIIDCSLQSDDVVGSTLVDMYLKFGFLNEARSIFDGISNKNVVPWGTMISGYVEHDKGQLAMKCFQDMQKNGILPSVVTFLSILKVCGIMGAIEQGRCLHQQIISSGLQSDIQIECAIVDMYAKCGGLKEAQNIFNGLDNQDAHLWCTLICGHAQLGEVAGAVLCFEKMQGCGIKPDKVAFSALLATFLHAGLVNEILLYFKNMVNEYDIKPDVYHITCLIDLLGRTGRFNEAENLLKVTAQPDVSSWMTLLSACNFHCNVDLGRRCFDAIIQLHPLYAPPYALMLNIYSRGDNYNSKFKSECQMSKAF